jgi:hypothetical protein
MIKRILLFITILTFLPSFPKFVYADKATKNDAKQVAENFLLHKSMTSKLSLSKQVVRSIKEIVELTELNANEILAHIVEIEPNGFVVISSDTDIEPVIAYSFRNNWCPDTSCANILYHMLKNDMKLRRKAINNLPDSSKRKNNLKWDNFIQKSLNKATGYSFKQWPEEGTTSTGGWIETTWHQRIPYNDFCPIDPTSSERSLVGCVATAMAQIVNYHKYIGNLEFDDQDAYILKNINIDADSTTFNFPSFETLNNHLNNVNYKYQNQISLESTDKAALNFASGISINTAYGSRSSGAQTKNVASALIEKFGFVSSEYLDFNDRDFEITLEENLMNALPAQLNIFTEAG